MREALDLRRVFFDAIEDCEEMIMRREINDAIIPKLQTLVNEFEKDKERWISQKEFPPDTAFVFYLALKNFEKILKKMIENVKVAKEKRENPLVAEDMRHVLPKILDIYIVSQTVIKGGIKTPNLDIMISVAELRNIAKQRELLPPFEEEIKGVDITILKKEFLSLSKDIAEYIHAK